MSARSIDPVSLGIMWDRLVSICDEGAATLIRTSFSTLVREGYDLSVMLFDAEGRMIAQSTKCIPVFIGTAPVTISHMLKRFPPDKLSPGDVVISNDPVIGTGHMYDIAVMRPVYDDATCIVGYTMSITHLPDIGGMGFSAAATELYHEGLRLPICKLVKAGVMEEMILDLIRLNVRVPEQVVGDIMAGVSCTEVVGRQLRDFMREYQLSSIGELSTLIRGQTERAVRTSLAAIPDAVYESAFDVEALGDPVRLACRIEKQGEEMRISFEGTGPCVRSGINVPICYSRSMALYSIKCLTTPNVPNNDGATAPITVSAPAGCILNAIAPAPSAGRHIIGHFVMPLIFAALAKAMPDRITADSGLINILTFQGRLRNGTPFAATYFAAGGFGALDGLDGHPTTPGSSNMACTPTEVFEDLTGMTILRKAIRPDSGGVGTYRGGPGQEIVMRNDTGYPIAVFSMANRTAFAARGADGGGPGALREHSIDGTPISPTGRHDLPAGGILTILEAGGGGFGAPAKRPRAAVLADVERGFLTPAGAKAGYGIDIATEAAQTGPHEIAS
ncbi:MAG: hydantoinase B/oxoprolinase family protein [Hyphomicrobiales bacterium]|nr:MAG: hydantoinase B/oxoprolinase family protein [Hyphomicrobiales bacterium]